MAITTCSSHPFSRFLLSSLYVLSSNQVDSQNIPPFSTPLNLCPKFGCYLASHDILKFATATGSCTAEAARATAAISGYEIYEVLGYRGSDNQVEEIWRKGSEVQRRKMRRKRRKKLECSQIERNCYARDNKHVFFKNSKSENYLTPQQVAECSCWLKEEANIEATRRSIIENSEHDITLNQWAKAMGINNGSLDKILGNGKESSGRIIRCYRKLVFSIAASYQGRGLSLQDLIQEGNIGLLRGAKKFNAEKGYKMSTYVYWWIRQAIVRAIDSKSRMIRLPGSICAVVPKVAEATTVLSKRLQRMPTLDEIAEVVEMDVATVKLICERISTTVSLDRTVTNQGCMSLQEIIPGPNDITPETMVRKQLMKQELEKLLNMMNTREAHVLRLRYGLTGETPRTFEEIGRSMKLSRERVRQINSIALSKLQQSTIIDNLKMYII